MGRLYRPHIPIGVRVQVAQRQAKEAIPSLRLGAYYAVDWTGFGARQLKAILQILAAHLSCDVSDLRLDHDPPLAARPRERRGLGKKTRYIPDANDPAHLFYRPHGPEYAGSHLVKTNVRGDHGQHPDRVLIKKARRAERGPKPKRAVKWPKRKMRSRPFEKPRKEQRR